MRRAFDVASIRAAEEAAIGAVGPDALMERAAFGLAVVTARILRATTGGVHGSRAALLVGTGNNGGDTLHAGAHLARRGVRVDALLVGPTAHEGGLAALRAAGGTAVPMDSETAVAFAARAVRDADVVLDGVVGIGGTGALRGHAATLARASLAGSATRIAVDVPSGVDAGTGAVHDPQAVFDADVTVTFAALKTGLIAAPGRDVCGVVEVVDIGLEPYLNALPDARMLTGADVRPFLGDPGAADHKYSRGVVGVLAGSPRYLGAGLLTVGGARRSGVGMVRYLDRGDSCAPAVISAYPDVVTIGDDPAGDPRVLAWAVGPGIGHTRGDVRWLLRVLAADVPIVLDADALTLLAQDGDVRDQVASRTERGALTVLTPHVGEFGRLGFTIGPEGRVEAARRAAGALRCIVVLKGSGSVVAAPGSTAYVDPVSSHDLATAGSGDVLTGLIGGMLAHASATVPPTDRQRTVAAAVFLHGLAASRAGRHGRPVVATDIIAALPSAVAALRRRT